GDIVLNAFSSPQPLPLPSILTLLLNGLTAVSLPILLILDDYHEIEAESIHEMMRFLLEHLPASVHFLLTTRVDPPFPLPRLRLRGQLTEIRTDALRFSQAETAVFLQQTIPLSLSAQAVQTLEQRTEGWIAALHAAALALQSQTTSETAQQLINTFSGTHRYIMDYLAEELLRQQSSAVQTFLLQTSILEQFCLPLCVAVTGEDRETAVSLLTHLEQNNLFLIPLDHERKWYRYHHLFRDFLRGQLATRDMKPHMLHARAAAWFGIQKMASAAISHWVQAAENKH
ncbi:MAG: hypothetical protein GY943_20840, partial [Chloroflexi bacterium]|nr:hypothetical protein [Chloroflexota bacterium]